MASDPDQEQISLWTAVHVEEHGQQKSVRRRSYRVMHHSKRIIKNYTIPRLSKYLFILFIYS